MQFRYNLISFIHQLEEEDNASLDLWTWLPSHKKAVKFHGNYASEHKPSPADVMREATMFIAHKLNPTEEQIKEAGELYECPCGEFEHSDEK